MFLAQVILVIFQEIVKKVIPFEVLMGTVLIQLQNPGKNDDTSLDGVNRFQKDVLNHNPAILIIDFGGNDIYNFSKKQTYSESEENFKTMLDQVDLKKLKST